MIRQISVGFELVYGIEDGDILFGYQELYTSQLFRAVRDEVGNEAATVMIEPWVKVKVFNGVVQYERKAIIWR